MNAQTLLCHGTSSVASYINFVFLFVFFIRTATSQEIKEIQLDESDKEDTEEMDVSDEEDSQPPKKKLRQHDYLKVSVSVPLPSHLSLCSCLSTNPILM